MVTVRQLLFILVLCLSLLSVAAQETDCIYYFYGDNCQDCLKVDKFLKQLETSYPELNLEKFEVYFSRSNSELLQKYFDAYQVPKDLAGVPSIFIGESYLSGSDSIQSFLESRIADDDSSTCPSLEARASVGIIGENNPHNVLKTLSFARTTGNAILHSFTGGLLATLLILITLLMMLRNKQDIAKRGFLFLAGFILTYILHILGFYNWFLQSQATNFYVKSIGLLAIIVGAVRIKGFFKTWEELFGKLSEAAQRKILVARMYFISPLGFLIIGFITSLFTLGKTSNVFLALRSVLQGNFQGAAFPILLYYLIMVCLPMLLVIFLLFNLITKFEIKADKKAETVQERESWKRHHWNLFNLIVSSILLVIGLLLLFI
jgi:glutaredoxin